MKLTNCKNCGAALSYKNGKHFCERCGMIYDGGNDLFVYIDGKQFYMATMEAHRIDMPYSYDMKGRLIKGIPIYKRKITLIEM